MEYRAEESLPSIPLTGMVTVRAFHEVVNGYFHFFQTLVPELTKFHHTFEIEAMPDSLQCERAHTLLGRTNEQIYKLRELLEDTSRLSQEVIAQRFLLLMALQNADVNSKQLLLILSSLSQSSSRQKRVQLHEMRSRFKSFKRAFSNVLNHAQTVLDQGSYQIQELELKPPDWKNSFLAKNALKNEDQGLEATQQGEHEKAQEYFERALRLIEKVDEHQHHARILKHLAQTARELGQKEYGSTNLKRALLLLERFNDPQLKASIYNDLGEVVSEQGDKKDALDYFEQARSFISSVQDPLMEARILANLGRTYSVLGRKQEAHDYLTKSLALIPDSNSTEKALTLNNLALVNADLGDIHKAIGALKLELPHFEKRDDFVTSRLYNSLGVCYNYLGEADEALVYYEPALKIRQDRRDLKGQAITLINIGWIHDSNGRKEQARQCYNDALTLSQILNDLWTEGKALSNLGQTYVDTGDNDKALGYIKQALEILEKVGDRWELTRVYNNFVRAFSGLGNIDEASSYYDRALENSRAIGDRRGEGRALCNIIHVRDLEENNTEISETLKCALLITQEVGDKKGEAWTLHNLARASMKIGKWEEARDNLTKALAIRKNIRDRRGEGWTLYQLGEVDICNGKYKNALIRLLEAQSIFLDIKSKDRDRVEQRLNVVQEKVGGDQFKEWKIQLEELEKPPCH